MEKDRPSDHHVIHELVVHGIAFFLAAILGAIVLWRFYWFFEWNTDSPSAAREAFLASVVVVGGVGPAITLGLFWLRTRMRRSRN
jgi:phosphoglycerol transferase MdoB-like AlkP superfamily enzyme